MGPDGWARKVAAAVAPWDADMVVAEANNGGAMVGSFPQLEDELAPLTAGGGYEGPSKSPDRAEAMVWAMTELSETRSGFRE